MGKAPQLYRDVNSLCIRIVQEICGIFGKVYAGESRLGTGRLQLLLFCYAGGWLSKAIRPHDGKALNVPKRTDGANKDDIG